MRRPHRILPLLTAALLVPGVLVGVASGSAGAAPPGSAVTTETLRPDGALPPSTAKAGEGAKAKADLLKLRDEMAANQPAPAAGPGKAVASAGKPTATSSGLASLLLVRRNNRNTVASSVGSTLAEPAAANDGNSVFYAGNAAYQSTSTNLGVNWTNVAIPAGPADAPVACCDWDAVRAHSRDRLFSSLLYVNNARTNGAVRIFVRSAPESAPLCSYTIDVAGAADNVLPDYPHIALTANFLYLTLNNVNRIAGVWNGAQIRRFNLTQMSACQSVNTNTFTHTGAVGQRVITPVEGAQTGTTMFFGAHETASSFRIFSWPEAAASPSQVVRAVATSSFANPDCRGGTTNTDFVGAIGITGFEIRGTVHGSRVTWFWNAANDANHAQAYVRGASFRASDLVLQEQPDIFNATSCFAYPAVTGNTLGDVGITVANGGRAGGGGAAVQGFVGVDDTPANAIHFGTVGLTASGTHNPADSRYGDYFTIRTNARCTRTYVATNYALSGGNTLSSHVNARYVEFGSDLDSACF